ncbi:MAG: hypothetical protein NTU94_16310 [Planctomycetota bacterium]|nr:hypothetical protein [Planctomycetota bacterium]
MKIITSSTRYRVTVITRRDRTNPFRLEIRDRLTGEEHREAIRDLTIRQRAEAYKRAAAREAELNGGAVTTRPVSWPEARTKGEATITAERRRGTAMAYRKGLDALERYAEDALVLEDPFAGLGVGVFIGKADPCRPQDDERKDQTVHAGLL